ncbi:uncharacterized protein LOC8081569 isoform X1 [Sorghum bicolor]|uniref:uncharacterized protein LOC8081569 isoform X1 n=1 Tax=Sorghum bicolor TaxID=4558 RepID=UPI000B4257EE|nr:uncharacterized protein LOC8081569 isoform X1 [Sorghum bicolor]|eukprot:XP_021306552.1 uncharacterized protein LOC8081569 isoform X1 [Sorghum bicolor]
MPSRSPRRSARAPFPSAAEPPPGLFPAREDLVRLLAVICIAAAAAAACSVLNRRPEPFCDSPQSPDDYADGTDSCQPCPLNGRCVDGELECVQGFKRQDKACIEDGLLSQTANKISELLQLWICNQHARALCGQPAEILFQQHDVSNAIDELLSKTPAGLTEAGIQLVKTRVLESSQDFFDTTFTSNKVKVFKCPELVAELHMPLACRVRQWISRNTICVATFCILLAALLWILWIIYRRRALSNRAEQIYEQVCEILEDNAINAKIDNSNCEPWVVTSWLRDHLLVPRERKNAFLWKKVYGSQGRIQQSGVLRRPPYLTSKTPPPPLQIAMLHAIVGASVHDESYSRQMTTYQGDRLKSNDWNQHLELLVEELILEDSRIDQYPKVIKGESKVVYEWQASGSLSAKIKKVQGARVKSRTGGGAIKFAEEMGACLVEVREQGSCDLIREERSKAKLTSSD